ncbi:MAG: SPASM domain-containing protein [Micromonosporaceae bacterium]
MTAKTEGARHKALPHADLRGALLPRPAPREFHLLARPTGAICNLDCTYWFLRDECGARFMQFIPIVERATPETLGAANAGWGKRVHDRPLHMQQGNLVTDLVAAPAQQEFGRAKRDTLPRYCLDCDVRFACHGGCPKDRFTATPDGEPGLHYLCPSYKAFFGHIRPAMAAMCELLRADRAPSELVRQYAAADSRRGRSGRKWKRCHQLTLA